MGNRYKSASNSNFQPQTLIFKHHYQTRRDLDKLEERANNSPGDARVQHIFLQSVVGVDPGFVIRRVESGKFALNKEVDTFFETNSNCSCDRFGYRN